MGSALNLRTFSPWFSSSLRLSSFRLRASSLRFSLASANGCGTVIRANGLPTRLELALPPALEREPQLNE